MITAEPVLTAAAWEQSIDMDKARVMEFSLFFFNLNISKIDTI